MVNKGGESCYIVGTPQTNDDFFLDAELRNTFCDMVYARNS